MHTNYSIRFVQQRLQGLVLGLLMGTALHLFSTVAIAAEYCCPCKSEAQEIEAKDDLNATVRCTAQCRRFTLARAGKCEGAPAAAAGQPAAARTGAVLLYKSEDCSGDPIRIDKATARLIDQGVSGMRSFAPESGAASVWERPDFAGRQTQPVGGSSCVSPGWPIASVRLQ